MSSFDFKIEKADEPEWFKLTIGIINDEGDYQGIAYGNINKEDLIKVGDWFIEKGRGSQE